MATIKIFNGDTTSEKLTLSDGGHTWEKRGRSIEWKIRDSKKSKVASIADIKVSSGADIFCELPNNKCGKWRAKIARNADSKIECKYSIFWIPKGATQALEHDPKISVLPSYNKLLLPIIAIAGACILYWLPKISNIRRK